MALRITKPRLDSSSSSSSSPLFQIYRIGFLVLCAFLVYRNISDQYDMMLPALDYEDYSIIPQQQQRSSKNDTARTQSRVPSPLPASNTMGSWFANTTASWFATPNFASVSTSEDANTNIQSQSELRSTAIAKPNVVCTYLRGNNKKYVMGTIVLMESVRAGMGTTTTTTTTTTVGNDSDDTIRTAVVCHESVSNETRALLRRLGHDVVVVQDVPFDEASLPTNRFKPLIQKYAVFDLVQYGKALFVDSDAFIYQPERLPRVFDMLDDDSRNPADPRWSVMKANNIPTGRGGGDWGSHKYAANATNSNRRRLFMAPDYGPDNFNSGLMLYRPEPNLFAEFRRFLNTTVAPLPQKSKNKLVRSTQRLLQEFLFLPATTTSLYNFCPDTLPSKCVRTSCDCDVHIYPHLLDCASQTDLWERTTVVHFAGSMLQVEQLIDPKSSPWVVNETIGMYFEKTLTEQVKYKRNTASSSLELECQRPMLHHMRHLYSSAMQRARLRRH